MRKIPTLFCRDENDRRHVTREVNPAAAWVLNGEGRPTRKYDGTCVMLDKHGCWWARREVKPGKPFPSEYVVEETDPNTGKTVGWEPVFQSPFLKAFREAVGNFHIDKDDLIPGTYELCGPKVNGNPEHFELHMLIPHGEFTLTDVPLDFDGLAAYLSNRPYEGIVWHHEDGRMAKLKRRDFS